MNVKRGFILFVVVSTVVLTTSSFYIYQILYSPNILVGKEDKIILIPQGSDFRYVQNLIYDNDIVQDAVSFSFLSRLMKYDENIKPGRYLLKNNSTNIEIIRQLRSGEQEPVRITFNNIRLLSDLSEKITDNIEIDSSTFNHALDQFVNQSSRWNNENILCMFIPNTYEVYWTISASALVERMEKEFNLFWNDTRMSQAKAIGLSTDDVCILSSIVQAETKIIEESKTIAGLYLNRINRNMYLQADPTLVYAAGDFTIKRVLNEHKEIDSPYNTYKYKGLPPGPINLPEIWALNAVLSNTQHKYIYMCAKEDFSGYHNFATNLRDHNANAARYQRALTLEQRKARMAERN